MHTRIRPHRRPAQPRRRPVGSGDVRVRRLLAGGAGDPREALPEGFDARLTFNRPRANARLHPAIQPHRTSARHYPDDRHERLAAAAREMLAAYERLDRPFALPDPLTFDDPTWATKAQALVRYLAHSFRPFELRTAEPASDATIAEVLDAVEALIDG